MTPSDTEPRARNGARRSPITMPGHNRGKPAPNKGMSLKSEYYSPEEMQRVLALFSRRGPCGQRDAALFVTLWRLGLRIDEALSAERRDVDLDRLNFYVRYPKRDKKGRARPRNVPMELQTAAILRVWDASRQALGVKATDPFFCVVDKRTRGRKMNAAVYRDKLRLLGARAGLEKRLHPHGLRTTCAVDLHFREGAPIATVQEWLGHADITTTSIYLRRYGTSEATTAFGRQRRWPGDNTAAESAGVDGVLAALREHATPDLVAAMAAALTGRDELADRRARAA